MLVDIQEECIVDSKAHRIQHVLILKQSWNLVLPE